MSQPQGPTPPKTPNKSIYLASPQPNTSQFKSQKEKTPQVSKTEFSEKYQRMPPKCNNMMANPHQFNNPHTAQSINMLGTLIWERKRARGFRAKEVGKSKTYDLVYSQSGLLAIQIQVELESAPVMNFGFNCFEDARACTSGRLRRRPPSAVCIALGWVANELSTSRLGLRTVRCQKRIILEKEKKVPLSILVSYVILQLMHGAYAGNGKLSNDEGRAIVPSRSS